MKKIAVITGATGGIGREYVKKLAEEQQYDIVMIDVDRVRLNEMAAELRATYNVNVETLVANLADAEAIKALVAKLSQYEYVDMFIHAAGYGEKTFFNDEPIQAALDMLSVHVSSAIQLIHGLLPGMLKYKSGTIIVVSSLASFIPAPGSSIYSGTKSFINSFLESLHMEVHSRGIKIQSLCPGLTHTGFHTESDIKRFEGIPGLDLWMEADEVVNISLAALSNDKVICIPGFINKSFRAAAGLLPRKSFYALVEMLNDKNK